MRTLTSLAIVLVGLSLCSCRLEDPRLKIAMEIAEDNNAGLTMVLNRFKNDPLRYEATRFIIENMPGKYSLDSASVSGNEPFYKALISFLRDNYDYGVTGLYDTTDSLEKAIGKPIVIPQYAPDLKIISPDSLSRRIDETVSRWESSTWKEKVPFEDFLRFVLPYRVYESWWDGTENYCRSILRDSVAAWSPLGMLVVAERIRSFFSEKFNQDGTFFKEHPYMLPTSYKNIVMAKIGTCYDFNSLVVTALRAFSIPATINTVPYWGNSNASHFWTEVIGTPVQRLYDNTQQDFHIIEDELVNDTFWFKGGVIDDTTGIPAAVKLRKTRTVPKIYRKNYEINNESLAFHNDEDIPLLFRDLTLDDITSEMVVTTNVRLKISRKDNPLGKHYAYLCCYDPDNITWTPVAWARIKRNKVFFKDIGVNIVYMMALYDEGVIIPIGDPFIPEASGIKHQLKAESENKESVEVFSKVPFRTNEVYYSMMMRGGRFQLANKENLLDTVTVANIDHIPFYTEEIVLENAPETRFALYRIEENPTRFVGEIEFWGIGDDGKEQKLDGKEIGNPCYSTYPRHNAFDGDRVSYAYFDFGNYRENYIGMDFGIPRKITRITFCPRNDDNAIIPGEEYELFYWQNGWRSLGKQYGGNDRRLHYNNVPAGALFRVHNHTRGKENRPFTIKNGEQVWW